MSKRFLLKDTGCPTPSTSHPTRTINWALCVLCQKDDKKKLTDPMLTKRQVVGAAYTSLAENLLKLNELNVLPRNIKIEQLDEGEGIEAALVANHARWHHACNIACNKTQVQRAEKRALEKCGSAYDDDDQANSRKNIRRTLNQKPAEEVLCFFCCKPAGTDGLHEATTLKLDSRVRACAELLQDTYLLGKLSSGDMVAIEAKYHTTCLVSLYNRARKHNAQEMGGNDEKLIVQGIAFAEIIMYMEEARLDENTAPIFKLADLAHLYAVRMEQLGIKLDARVNTTRFKQRLLAQIPDLQAVTKGRDVILSFSENIGEGLTKLCEWDSDRDAIYLGHAARIVRRHMFAEKKVFTGFHEGCQRDSVPNMLLTLVNMILEGPTVSDQSEFSAASSALTIAQLLQFNSVKRKRFEGHTTSSTVRHSTDQETPLPMYIGMMLHAKTRKRELVDRLSHMGVSISYDRVLRLSAQLGETAIQQFHKDQVVCPTHMRGNVFTTAAIDNIDHNPSSTTSKESFHGTGISLLQHPVFVGQGIDRSIAITEDSSGKKTVGHLPSYYTVVPTATSNTDKASPPPITVTSLGRENSDRHMKEEYKWLENVQKIIAPDDKENSVQETVHNISWAAYYASRQSPGTQVICQSALLPLFHESAHTVAMIKHSMAIVQKAVHHLNAGQTPVVTFDQPLYAISKQIQWTLPEMYGEDKFVVMFGGLHIEMTAMKCLGHWLKGSGWVESLVQANITTAGIADSLLHAAHVARTRHAHQVTVAALYILQDRAYENHDKDTEDEPLGFSEWCSQREKNCPQFLYWATVMRLELCLLVFVRSQRQSSFSMYLDALTELVPWFFALDHTNYARWIPVHIRDMTELPATHPDVNREFNAGNFTFQKTNRAFSAIAIDQAHEQNNACIKSDGGAIGLTDNPSALRRWMVACPQVATLIAEFDAAQQLMRRQDGVLHHDQIASVQTAFQKDVRSLVNVIEELGNPFEEESEDLLVLDSREIAHPMAVETVRKAHDIGKQQFQAFVEQRLVARTKPIGDTIKRNGLKIFVRPTTKVTNKENKKVLLMKSDVQLFSRLYISCQTRDGNLQDFFRHENQAWPPALSDGGMLRIGNKSDLLTCLEDLSKTQTKAPDVTCLVIDGAAIIQMLKPAGVKTFDEYAQHVVIPYVSSQLRSVSRLDIVWDIYKDDSLKGTARAKRGKGIRRRVVGNAFIPGNWQNFLRDGRNKTELFSFLSKALLRAFRKEDKEVVLTDGNGVLNTHVLEDLKTLAPCSHEEADTRMLLHVSHASQHGHHQILIRTVDTDVVVLAVFAANQLPSGCKLWLAFGTGKNFRYLAAHEMAACLGPEMSRSLPMFHSLTGCDTVSSFAGHGKKTAWSTWKSLPELTDALLMLTNGPSEIPDDAMKTIERFVIILYDRTSICTEVDNARMKLFPRKNSVQQIPPTHAALVEHVKRAVYQGGHIWGQTLVPSPVQPSPTDWSWVKKEGMYEPYWTTLPQASESCLELISCGCKSGCTNRCRCKKAALQCTGLCFCEGECGN